MYGTGRVTDWMVSEASGQRDDSLKYPRDLQYIHMLPRYWSVVKCKHCLNWAAGRELLCISSLFGNH